MQAPAAPAWALIALRNWAIDGTREKAFTALLAQADTEGDLDWSLAVDSTTVRAHHNSAGVRKKGPGPGRRARSPCHRTRSRGGLSTKIHLVADGLAPPNRLKNWRGLATRYEKSATVSQAALHIAGIFLWSAR